MVRRILPHTIVTACMSAAWPAVAADGEVANGLVNTSTGMLLIAIAAALIVMLLLRVSASHVSGFLSRKIGQHRIRSILRHRSKDVLEDFILPGAYGGLTRIDHAILTSGGILCIQTKHYKGVILGGAEEPQWTNVDGIHRRRFLNPMIQNEGRTTALQKVVPGVPVANLVVFTGAVQLASAPLKNVVRVKDLDSFIARFEFGPCKIDDWDAAWLAVKSEALTDEGSRKDFDAQLSFS